MNSVDGIENLKLLYLYRYPRSITVHHTPSQGIWTKSNANVRAKDGVKAKFYKDESIRHFICSKQTAWYSTAVESHANKPFFLPSRCYVTIFQWANFLLYRLLANWQSLAPTLTFASCAATFSISTFPYYIHLLYTCKWDILLSRISFS